MGVDSATNHLRTAWLREQLRTGLLASARALSHLLEGEMARALAIVPLGGRGFAVLLEIASEPAASQRDLATRLALSAGTVSDLLTGLVAAGLLRRASPRRGRCGRPGTTLQLTAKGVDALAAGTRIARRVERDWARRLAIARGAVPPLVAMGLRRWLRESAAALREQAGRGRHGSANSPSADRISIRPE